MLQFNEISKCFAVVNRIINRTNAQNTWRYEQGKSKIKLTGKRVQKIVYLCYLFWIIEHEECDMIPENFVAWPNGPVIPEIYNYWLVYQDGDMLPCPHVRDELNEEESNIINIVVDNTIDISTEAIIDFIQSHDKAWQQACKDASFQNDVILPRKIKRYIRDENHQKELFDFIGLESNEHKKLVLKKIDSTK